MRFNRVTVLVLWVWVSSLSAAPFSCRQMVWNTTFLNTSSSLNSLPHGERPTLEMSVAVAIFAIEQLDLTAANKFRELATQALGGSDVAEQVAEGGWTHPLRFVFPPHEKASVPRIPLVTTPTVQWPLKIRNSRQQWFESSLQAIKLIFEVEGLDTLPPNAVRVNRHFNGSYAKFIQSNTESFYYQYLLYRAFSKDAQPVRLPSPGWLSRWLPILAGRAKTNPFYRSMFLPAELAYTIATAPVPTDEPVVKAMAEGYLNRKFKNVSRMDRTGRVFCAGFGYSCVATAAMLAADVRTTLRGIPELEVISAPLELHGSSEIEVRDWEQRSPAELEEILDPK